jgi:hypothetical protein
MVRSELLAIRNNLHRLLTLSGGPLTEALSMIKKIIDKGNRVAVFAGDGIGTMKVNARLNIPSLFVGKKNGSSCRRGGTLNVTTFEIGVDIFSNNLLLYRSKLINWTKRR